MAAPTPKGKVKSAVRLMSQVVPNMADFMPAFSGSREGKLVKKWRFKKGRPSRTISSRRIIKATMPKRVAKRQRISNIIPFRLRIFRFFEVKYLLLANLGVGHHSFV